MKLEQFLYEAAQTVEGSLSKGIAAVKLDGVVVLFSARRVMEAFQRFAAKEHKGDSYYLISKLSSKLANDAVVGHVSYSSFSDPTEVASSSGVNKFGPLAYQLVMYRIHPRWLRSDTSLTEGDGSGGSQNIWNKMYELSNQGIYERRWLGSFYKNPSRFLKEAKMVNGSVEEMLSGYEPEKDPSEEGFLSYIEKQGYDPKFFGHFWAYRLRSPDPKIEELFAAGDKLRADIASLKIYNLYPRDISDTLELAANKFFERRYQ